MLAREDHKCVIIVTHAPDVAKSADVIYTLTSIKNVNSTKAKNRAAVKLPAGERQEQSFTVNQRTGAQ